MNKTGILPDLGIDRLNGAVHRSLKGSLFPLPEQSQAKMILIVDLADLRQPYFIRRTQELLREVIQSNSYPIVALKRRPGMAPACS